MAWDRRSVLQDRGAATEGDLDEHRIMLRWLAIEDCPPHELVTCLSLLDETEQARAARFHADHDRHAYILAHALTRLMLSSRGSLAPRDWRFQMGRYGKPRIAADHAAAGLQFNLSHTRGMVAVALALGHEIGVDVERIEAGRLSFELAAKTFAPSEVAHLAQLPPGLQTTAALTLWTLKEAYIKATGQGLSCPLDSFAFTLDPLRIAFMPPEIDDPGFWLFRSFQPRPDYVLALALRAPQTDRMRIDARGLEVSELSSWLSEARN